MAYGGNSQLFYTTVGVVKEATWHGEAGANWLFLPVTEPRFNPSTFRHIVDSGLRGLPSEDFDLIPGPGEGTFQWSGAVYAEPFPALLNTTIGADSVSGSANPYTHTMDADIIPPSMFVQWATDVMGYTMSGARTSQLTLNFNGTDGSLNYQVQGMGRLGVPVPVFATLVTPTFSTLPPIAGWQGTIAGITATVLEGSITFARTLKPLHAIANSQDVSALHAGPLKVTGRLTLEFAGVTDYNAYVAATKGAATLKFTRVASPEESITVRMTNMGWREATIDVSDNIYTVVLQFSGLHNVTDSGPVYITTLNPRSLSYNA